MGAWTLENEVRRAEIRLARSQGNNSGIRYPYPGRPGLGRLRDEKGTDCALLVDRPRHRASAGGAGLGAKVIGLLAHDLQVEFAGVERFRPRSSKYMRSVATAWPDEPIVQHVAAQLPWGHPMVLPDT